MSFNFLKPLAIVDPVDLCKCVRLQQKIVPNTFFYRNGVDELMDAECLFGLWRVGYVGSGEPIIGELLSF